MLQRGEVVLSPWLSYFAQTGLPEGWLLMKKAKHNGKQRAHTAAFSLGERSIQPKKAAI